jgi:hypothetical protein
MRGSVLRKKSACQGSGDRLALRAGTAGSGREWKSAVDFLYMERT